MDMSSSSNDLPPEQDQKNWEAQDWKGHFEKEPEQKTQDALRQEVDTILNGPTTETARYLKNHFADIDKNKDGILDIAEVNADKNLIIIQNHPEEHLALKQLVDDGDNDNKGISAADVDELYKQENAENKKWLAVFGLKELGRHFDRIDRDNDGRITTKEIQALVSDPLFRTEFRTQLTSVLKVLEDRKMNQVTYKDIKAFEAKIHATIKPTAIDDPLAAGFDRYDLNLNAKRYQKK